MAWFIRGDRVKDGPRTGTVLCLARDPAAVTVRWDGGSDTDDVPRDRLVLLASARKPPPRPERTPR